MTTNGHTDARTLHNRLRHPVIDADGHWIEYGPIMKRGVPAASAARRRRRRWRWPPSACRTRSRMSVAERGRRRVGQESFWSSPSENVLDRATAMLPRLMYERLDELGIDFSVVYPTAGLSFHRMQDTRLRRAICRAYNVFAADQFRGLGDRMIPAAIIPMYTPEEAIEELEYAVHAARLQGRRWWAASCGGAWPPSRRRRPRPRSTSSGTTSSASTAPTTTTPSGRSAASCGWRRASTTARAPSCCATRRPTSATTTSATSPPPATPSPRRSSSAGSPAASPT